MQQVPLLHLQVSANNTVNTIITHPLIQILTPPDFRSTQEGLPGPSAPPLRFATTFTVRVFGFLKYVVYYRRAPSAYYMQTIIIL